MRDLKRIMLRNMLLLLMGLFCLGPVWAADGDVIPGDLNNDETIDLADAIIGLQLSAGIAPKVAASAAADINNDGEIGLPESLYALQCVAWLGVSRERWMAQMFDDAGASMGFLAFILETHPDGGIIARGNYDIVVSVPPYVVNQPVKGSFTNQPMTINGDRLSTTYTDNITQGVFIIDFTLAIEGTTHSGIVADGQWALDFTSPFFPDQNGAWTGYRQTGEGITQ